MTHHKVDVRKTKFYFRLDLILGLCAYNCGGCLQPLPIRLYGWPGVGETRRVIKSRISR